MTFQLLLHNQYSVKQIMHGVQNMSSVIAIDHFAINLEEGTQKTS